MKTPINFPFGTGWHSLLLEEFDKVYFKELMDFVEGEYHSQTIYPPKQDIFKAFELCPLNKVKVVLIGQDPYHGAHQAQGLCFSVNEGVQHPPSLKNVFKELQFDVGKEVPQSGDLSHWATQGVLMLNAVLTVRDSEAGSHKNRGWEHFTAQAIKQLSYHKEGLIFLLWGGFAKKMKSRIAPNRQHIILEGGHPSPLSANRGYWFGNRHFSKVNQLLREFKKDPIYW